MLSIYSIFLHYLVILNTYDIIVYCIFETGFSYSTINITFLILEKNMQFISFGASDITFVKQNEGKK